MNEKQLLCKHQNFAAHVSVGRLTENGEEDEHAQDFVADVRIHCADCELPFSFKGLPYGLNLDGGACSPDGLEGRFGIAPGSGGMFTPDEGGSSGLRGFGITQNPT